MYLSLRINENNKSNNNLGLRLLGNCVGEELIRPDLKSAIIVQMFQQPFYKKLKFSVKDFLGECKQLISFIFAEATLQGCY